MSQGWKYAGDYLHLKSDSALAIRFLTREWKAEAEGLYELVEAIRALVRKERMRIKWTWIPLSQNVVADAMCHIAREAGGVMELWGEDHGLLCGSIEILCIVPELRAEGVERGRENFASDEESGFVGIFGGASIPL